MTDETKRIMTESERIPGLKKWRPETDDDVRRWVEGVTEEALGWHPLTCRSCNGLGVADEGGACMVCDGEGWTMEVRKEMTEKTTPTTFEPDWAKLCTAGADSCHHEPYTEEVQVIITEYHRQMAEAGKITVDRDVVKRINDFLHVFDDRPFHLSKVETIPEYEHWFSDIETAWEQVSVADWDHIELAANEGEGNEHGHAATH